MKEKFWSSAGLCECRISGSNWFSGQYYCDTCGKYFDDKEQRPCGIDGVLNELLKDVKDTVPVKKPWRRFW